MWMEIVVRDVMWYRKLIFGLVKYGLVVSYWNSFLK